MVVRKRLVIHRQKRMRMIRNLKSKAMFLNPFLSFSLLGSISIPTIKMAGDVEVLTVLYAAAQEGRTDIIKVSR